MKIIFSNQAEVECLGVHGKTMTYQGVNRDALTFLFSPMVELSEIVALFNSNASELITLVSDDSRDYHSFYTIFNSAGVGLRSYVIGGYDGEDSLVAWVTMIQTTLAEREILNQKAAIEQLIVSALEG